MLTPAALRLLARAETCGIDDLLAPGLPPRPAVTDMFRPGTDLGPLLKVLAANDPAALKLRSPALIVQGNDDPIVARSRTDQIARGLRAGGARLAYRRYSGTGHFDLLATALTESARWLGIRLAERPR